MRSLLTRASLGTVLIMLFVGGSPSAGQRGLLTTVGCRHDQSETVTDRLRRDQALLLARQINRAERESSERVGKFKPVEQLAGLPEVPAGFELHFYVDGETYIFSLKDKLDGCHYGLFSDHAAVLYEITPGVPLIATAKN
jgi:hypothetical protein